MWENAYLGIKNRKASGPLSGLWIPAADSLLHSHEAAPRPNPGSAPVSDTFLKF